MLRLRFGDRMKTRDLNELLGVGHGRKDYPRFCENEGLRQKAEKELVGKILIRTKYKDEWPLGPLRVRKVFWTGRFIAIEYDDLSTAYIGWEYVAPFRRELVRFFYDEDWEVQE